jgi:hypothetical protein
MAEGQRVCIGGKKISKHVEFFKKNTSRAQTTRLALFGPVVVVDTQPTHLGGCLTTRRRSTHSLVVVKNC